jgi:hypothetical protein
MEMVEVNLESTMEMVEGDSLVSDIIARSLVIIEWLVSERKRPMEATKQ